MGCSVSIDVCVFHRFKLYDLMALWFLELQNYRMG
jgi:hypothetical protein